jgi:hypothetical protein
MYNLMAKVFPLPFESNPVKGVNANDIRRESYIPIEAEYLQVESSIPAGTPNIVIDHVDGDKSNDCIWNLRYTTNQMNTILERGRPCVLIDPADSETRSYAAKSLAAEDTFRNDGRHIMIGRAIKSRPFQWVMGPKGGSSFRWGTKRVKKLFFSYVDEVICTLLDMTIDWCTHENKIFIKDGSHHQPPTEHQRTYNKRVCQVTDTDTGYSRNYDSISDAQRAIGSKRLRIDQADPLYRQNGYWDVHQRKRVKIEFAEDDENEDNENEIVEDDDNYDLFYTIYCLLFIYIYLSIFLLSYLLFIITYK